MTEEFLDVLTPEGKPTGTVKPRDEIHKDGTWHASVHIWIVDKEADAVLIQKRSDEKESFPGYYDVASAGHVRAGEAPVKAAIRETEEEIGLRLTKEQLHQVEVQKICYSHDEFISNEYNYVYVAAVPRDAWSIKLQEEEVAGTCWVSWSGLQSDLERKVPGYCIDPEEAGLVFKWVRSTL